MNIDRPLTASLRRSSTLALFVAGLSFAGGPALVANATWTGGGASDNWSDSGNWSGAVTGTLGFTGTLRTTSTNDLTAGTSFGALSFSNVAYTLNGNQITLGGNVTNSSGFTQTLNLALVLSANRTFTTQATTDGTSASIIVNGVISDADGVRSLVKAGEGILRLSGANTYTGPTQINAGIVEIDTLTNTGTASSIGSGGAIYLNGGTLRYTGAGGETDRAFTLGTSLAGSIESSGTGIVKFTNTGQVGISGNNARTLTLGGTNTGNNTLSLALKNGSGNNGKLSIVKEGAGTWRLNGDNDNGGGTTNYSLGGTTVNAGTLVLDGNLRSSVVINAGGRFGGSGTVTGDRTHVYGTIFAAAATSNSAETITASVGKLTVGNLHFYSGGSYELDLATDGSTGGAGIGWDQVYANFALTLGAQTTGVGAPTSANPFTIKLNTLTAGGMAGALTQWDYGQSHTWSDIVNVKGNSADFLTSDLFTVDASGFGSDYQGHFSVVASFKGNNRIGLDLIYTYDENAPLVPGAIPEPATCALVAGLGILGAAAFVRRQRC